MRLLWCVRWTILLQFRRSTARICWVRLLGFQTTFRSPVVSLELEARVVRRCMIVSYWREWEARLPREISCRIGCETEWRGNSLFSDNHASLAALEKEPCSLQ